MKTCPYCGSSLRYDCPVEWRCGSVSDVYRSRDCLQKEIGLLKERVKRLEEAGDAMDPMNDTECECDDRSVLICKYCFDSSTRWFKAKEAKP